MTITYGSSARTPICSAAVIISDVFSEHGGFSVNIMAHSDLERSRWGNEFGEYRSAEVKYSMNFYANFYDFMKGVSDRDDGGSTARIVTSTETLR